MKAMSRWMLVCVLVLVLVGAIGCTGSSDEGGDAETSSATFESGTAEAGGWKVTVDSVEAYDASEKEPSVEGNVFLAAEVTFENTTAEETWWDTAQVLAMRDGDGNLYPADGMILANDIELVMGSAQPADPRGGLVAFEVPGDATGLVLVFTPEELGEEEEAPEWSVGDAADY